MSKVRKYKNLVVLLVIPVLLIFISNSLINRHNHQIRGFNYTHAHPFNKGDDCAKPVHEHSQNELIILDIISDIEFVVVFILVSLFINRRLFGQLSDIAELFPGRSALLPFGSRGPPVYTI